MLNMMLVTPSKYKKSNSVVKVEGLLGNYDGDVTNEWIKPIGAGTNAGSTESEYYTYGKSCKYTL
jgi:hypothetical protein